MERERDAVDFKPAERETVLNLLKRFVPDTEIWAYGSRVKGTSTSTSDLDLVAFAGPEQKRAVSDLKEAFEESSLPFRVDLFVWSEIPEQFRKNIEAEHAVLQIASEKTIAGE